MNHCEVWKSVVGYEGKYEVSSQGRVRSLSFLTYSGSGRYRSVKPKILKLLNAPYGYLKVNLCNTSYKVHKLVGDAFLDKPEIGGYHGATINHKDGNKKNNRMDNLEWVSIGDNLKHARDTGLNSATGSNNPMSKLSKCDAVFAKIALLRGFKQKEIADFLGVTHQWVSKVKNNLLWKHIKVELENGEYVLYDQQTPEQEEQGELKTVFKDGILRVEHSLEDIRQRVKESL